MSKSVENILYIGHNIQFAKTMLNLSGGVSTEANYCLHHLSCVNDIQATLAEREYSHFICELPISEHLIDRIATDFPLLKTNYLTSFDTPKTTELSAVMEGLVSDDVKATLEFLSIPTYFKNRQGQFLACNSYFSHLFGLTPAQVIGKTAADVVHPYLLEGIEELDLKVFDQQKVYFYECKIMDLAGRERDVVFRKESVANNKIQIGMIFDVTDINEAKSLLEKERLMLRATADISTDFIFFKDSESRYLGCNKEFERVSGYPKQELLGKTDDQLFEAERASIWHAQDKEVLSKSKTFFIEEHQIDKNGERHFIEVKKVPLQDKLGKVQGLIGVGRDISEHHRVQRRLKIADAAFENSKENMLVTDENGYIIAANKACCATTGFPKSELLQSHISIFASSQHDNIETALQGKRSWQGDGSYRIKNGATHFGWVEVYLVEDLDKGSFNRIYSFVDSTQSKSAEEKIQFLSKHDPLTGLFNRIALFTRLEDAITRAAYKQATMAVLLVDINGFKRINDQYGHNAGDAVLKDIAERLKNCIFEKETLARFGDDQIVIIVDELTSEQAVSIVAQKIARQFTEKFTIKSNEVNLSAAIGIAMYPDDGTDVDTLIGNAEKAMLRGKPDKSHEMDGDTLPANSKQVQRCKKESNDTPYHFYTSKLTDHSRQQVKFEDELKQALLLEQFELYYQPQYDLNKRQIVAVEALLRWNHPQRGIQEPESFLIMAESSGLVQSIGLLMIRKAAMQAVAWQKSAINFGRIAINLSETQLSESSFIADLQTILLETKCSSQWLEFEIDEMIFKSDSPVVYENLVNIAKVGVALTVANFAEDRPVLYLFEQLRIEKFKMSKRYTETPTMNFIGSAMQDGVFALASSLGIDVVADSLGNREEDSFLSQNSGDSGEWRQNKAMKASQATFYLRCNKRK